MRLTSIVSLSAALLLSSTAIAQDKKVKGGKLTFILTRGIGQSFVADDVPSSEVLSFLTEKHPR